jgi:hypothetical protein
MAASSCLPHSCGKVPEGRRGQALGLSGARCARRPFAARAAGFAGAIVRLRSCRQLDLHSPQHAHECRELGIAFFSKRFVQSLAGYTGAARHIRHSASAGNGAEGIGDIGGIAGRQSVGEKVDLIGGIGEVFGRIEGECFGDACHAWGPIVMITSLARGQLPIPSRA